MFKCHMWREGQGLRAVLAQVDYATHTANLVALHSDVVISRTGWLVVPILS